MAAELPVIKRFEIVPNKVSEPNQFGILYWEVENARDNMGMEIPTRRIYVDADHGIPIGEASRLAGSARLVGHDTTTFILTASNDNGSITQEALYTVDPSPVNRQPDPDSSISGNPAIDSFTQFHATATPPFAPYTQVELRWQTSNTLFCTLDIKDEEPPAPTPAGAEGDRLFDKTMGRVPTSAAAGAYCVATDKTRTYVLSAYNGIEGSTPATMELTVRINDGLEPAELESNEVLIDAFQYHNPNGNVWTASWRTRNGESATIYSDRGRRRIVARLDSDQLPDYVGFFLHTSRPDGFVMVLIGADGQEVVREIEDGT